MRKYLLPKEGSFYKANLHSHSTMSDGLRTPQELKELYMAQGYSVFAFTDHNLMFAHPELLDENFVPLTSYEWGTTEPERTDRPMRRTCHICVIAPTLTGTPQVGYHRTKHPSNDKELRHLVEFDENEPDFEWDYSPENINRFMKKARDMGYFVTYNHPTWSCDDYSDYMALDGMDAMEIVTWSSQVEGWEEYNPRVYDDMLRGGKRIFCTATDDNHDWYPDNFGGFTMIKAEKLDYPTIFAALKAGNFYASEGPRIHELYLETEGEDTFLHVKCSGAASVFMTTGVRKADAAWAKDGELVTEAKFQVKSKYVYFRVTVTGPDGKHACSNAYFTDAVL